MLENENRAHDLALFHMYLEDKAGSIELTHKDDDIADLINLYENLYAKYLYELEHPPRS